MPPKKIVKQPINRTFKLRASNPLIDRNPMPAPESKTLEEYISEEKQKNVPKQPVKTGRKGLKTLPRNFKVKSIPRGIEDLY